MAYKCVLDPISGEIVFVENFGGWYRTDIETFVHISGPTLSEYDPSGALMSIGGGWSGEFVANLVRTSEFLGFHSPLHEADDGL